MITAKTLKAEMAGTIVAVERQPGDNVEFEDIILILESMKMEIPVLAPAAGRVTAIHVAEGDTVEEDQPLAAMDTE